jgi:hypothetical protein
MKDTASSTAGNALAREANERSGERRTLMIYYSYATLLNHGEIRSGERHGCHDNSRREKVTSDLVCSLLSE